MNIFQLQEEYLYLMQDIEQAEGEITEELAERLAINKEDFSAKMDAYANIIAQFTGEIAIIDTELERLKGLKTSKENAITRMKAAMNDALKLFGEPGKTGNQTFKTPLHSYWNVYHKPLVIDDDAKVPVDYIGYNLKTQLPHNLMEEVSDTLASYSKDYEFTFEDSVKRTELKKAIEGGLTLDGVRIDDKASYLRIK